MVDILNSGTMHIGSKAFLKNKVELSIEKVIPGMVTASDVFNSRGAIIISENTVLEPSVIKTLKRLEIHSLKIYDNNIDSPLKVFQEKYLKDLSMTSHLMEEISSGKPLDINKVNNVVDSIIQKNVESEKILRDMNYSTKLGEYEYTHCINVSMLSMLIARWLNYSENDLKMVARSGFLHDIGKAKIDKTIIYKTGPLTKQEHNTVEKHVDYGMEIIENIPGISDDEGMGILQHHERIDGSGYIHGLKSNEINEFAKIIAVADVFDAMSSDRSYSKSIPVFDIFDQMETYNVGSLDKRILMTFLQFAPVFYTGEKFFLSNNEIGEIIHITPGRVAKPLVKVGDSYVDLSKESNISLGRMV